MKIVSEPYIFDWDFGNSDKNLKKHWVTNQQAEEAFTNKPKFIFLDPKHSIKEKRYLLWGIANNGRQLTLVYTLREQKIRIISVRDMNKKERSAYEKKIKTNT